MGGEAWFVGREDELAVLGARLEQAVGGSGGLVLVAGAAGIGKTRMLAEFAAAARARGALTLWGPSFEGGWHPPYGPWVEAWTRPCGPSSPARAGHARGRRAGAGPAAALAGRQPRPERPAGAAQPEKDRFRLFDRASWGDPPAAPAEPAGMAEGLAGFFARHSLPVAAGG